MTKETSSPLLPPLAVAPADGARIIGVGRTKFYELLNSGALRSFKVGNRRLVTMTTLREYVAKLEAEAQQ